MITGTHLLLYSTDPDADRAFFRDVLAFHSVDAGGGWLIFALPPAEMGVHAANGPFVQRHADHDMTGVVLYLMCDDLHSMVKALQAKNVACSKIEAADWGKVTSVALPSGGRIGLYQPTHPTAFSAG